VHWVWDSNGFLGAFNSGTAADDGTMSDIPILGGQTDFAGSGVVHMTGGVAALVGAAIIGPRSGRFDGGGRSGKPMPIKGHSSVLQVMGTFILWLGWYGFNPGSTLGITPPGYAMGAARVVVTTTLAAAAGGITVCLLEKALGSKTWDVGAVCNGILGGLVSITAGCSVTYPWAALLIGFLGGFVYFGASKLVLNVLKVDDPLDAFAVHGACGFWGCVATALFAAPPYAYHGGLHEDCAPTAGDDGKYTVGDDCNCPLYDDSTGQNCAGVGAFYGCGCLLGVTLAALVLEFLWVGIMSAMMFMILKAAGILRVSQEVEEAGMDVSKHGGSAYEMEVGAKPASSTMS